MSDKPQTCATCWLLRDGSCPYRQDIGRMVVKGIKLSTMQPEDRPCAAAGTVLWKDKR